MISYFILSHEFWNLKKICSLNNVHGNNFNLFSLNVSHFLKSHNHRCSWLRCHDNLIDICFLFFSHSFFFFYKSVSKVCSGQNVITNLNTFHQIRFSRLIYLFHYPKKSFQIGRCKAWRLSGSRVLRKKKITEDDKPELPVYRRVALSRSLCRRISTS